MINSSCYLALVYLQAVYIYYYYYYYSTIMISDIVLLFHMHTHISKQ
jgi:hypothetical protein